MAMNEQQYAEFWNKVGPGLLDAYMAQKKAGSQPAQPTDPLSGMIGFGAGLYSRNAAEREAADRLRAAQGPVFQQSNAAASGMLSQLGSANPDQFAADRFNAGEALVAPRQEADLNQLMRTLRAKGQLGIASFEPATSYSAPGMGARTPIEGAVAPNGQAINPNIAAFYAAQNADRAKRAAASMQQGQDYIGNLVSRAGMLQGTANNAQATGIAAQRTQPSRATANAELIKGGLGVLKDSGILKDVVGRVPGMISGGVDWMKNLFGGGDDLFGGADFSLGF